MSFSSALNPDVIKTAIDDVFMAEWNGVEHPGFVTAESGLVFKQDSTDRAAEIIDTFAGVPLWQQRAEEADVLSFQPRITNQKTYNVVNFDSSIDIPKTFFDDNMHGSYEKAVRDFAWKAMATRDNNAFAVYRNAFTTTLTADTQAFASTSHALITGGTVSNYITNVLAEPSLNTAIVGLVEQKDQAGVVMGQMPETLLVPPKLFKLACEICKSELKSGVNDNDINVYSSQYGINICTSSRLGSVSGGSDTAWFLLGRNHSVTRYVRAGVETELVPYQYQRNNVYIYKGEFREVVGVQDYAGTYISDGTV